MTNAANVTSSLIVNNGICTYSASNSAGTPVGAWSKASKTFSTPLDISGGKDTLGVWIYGDNKGEILNFQLYRSTPDCRLYNSNGGFITNVTPTGSTPVLNTGDNYTWFYGTPSSGYNMRAKVTLFADGPQIYP